MEAPSPAGAELGHAGRERRRRSSRPDDDAEWEYEYDAHETEDFYVTLDLTSHVPGAVVQPPSVSKKRQGKRKTAGASSTGRRPTSGSPAPPDAPPANTSATPAADGDAPPAGELQLVGLHTTGPFVRFNGEVYRCYWSTDLGTQFYLSAPGVVSDPLRKGHVLDVVGISQARLLGQPVTLRERKKPPPAENDEEGVSNATAIAIPDDEDDADDAPSPAPNNAAPPAGRPLVVPKERITDEASQAQASFLERLSAIKLQKGELDPVPVTAVKHYIPPPNQDEIRRRALEAQAHERSAENVEPPPSKRQKVNDE